MFALVSSLRTMASLRPERMFPGSGSIRRTPLPDLHGKIGALIQLAQEVDRLEGSGCSTPEMVEMLFHGEPRIKFWTMGHFSAANLVEACRSYNAIVKPLDTEHSSLHRAAGTKAARRSAGLFDEALVGSRRCETVAERPWR